MITAEIAKFVFRSICVLQYVMVALGIIVLIVTMTRIHLAKRKGLGFPKETWFEKISIHVMLAIAIYMILAPFSLIIYIISTEPPPDAKPRTTVSRPADR